MSTDQQNSMRALKEELIDEHGPYCWRCQKMYNTNELEGHHILPRSSGGKNNKANIAMLCHNCHSELHQAINSGNWKKYNKVMRKVKYNSTVLKKLWFEFTEEHSIKISKV